MSNPSTVTVHLVKAFSYRGSGGSLTGVVLEPKNLTAQQMQLIAARSSASHVAFLSPNRTIRFFTQAGELKNCAHATIAAHWLVASREAITENQTFVQQTQAGPQQVWVEVREKSYSVRFAQHNVRFVDVADSNAAMLLHALGLETGQVDDLRIASPGTERFLVAVASREILLGLRPNFSELEQLCQARNSLGCFVYCLESAHTAHARMFAPAIGVDEDMINGNSSGCLGSYLLRKQLQEGRAVEEVRLEVFQGMAFDSLGCVTVTARRAGERLEGYIEGTAWEVGLEEIELD